MKSKYINNNNNNNNNNIKNNNSNNNNNNNIIRNILDSYNCFKKEDFEYATCFEYLKNFLKSYYYFVSSNIVNSEYITYSKFYISYKYVVLVKKKKLVSNHVKLQKLQKSKMKNEKKTCIDKELLL
ncbi:hypothetical protein BCR32DRAFT_282982 [Anaeromyces robustus]|uniref:Uncharacterized protein n=1 Tax=Anaeromyces robustus TaxID=1754192 RepID=A0A1Y1WVX2_9FUNG|nr:hypothetical protein BCR32DRAFT_282982 [Anaeromyces robustus]|eukprot:ORX77663.1 hypothetical protein BCR32DRAFT_282982 [Anaeromyces robustus]